MRDFVGRVAVVTGGSRGIGLGIGRALVREGASVVFTGTTREIVDQALANLQAVGPGASVRGLVSDVADRAAVQRLHDTTVADHGRVDLLVCNAGVTTWNRITEHTLADWKWVIGVNLLGVVNCIDAFLPTMLAQDTDSRIVNIASVAGLLSHMPFQAPYGATKAAVVSLSESLRTELADAGAKVGVTVVCPGRIATDVTRSDRSRPDGLEVRPPEARAYHEMISGMLSPEGGAMSIDDFGELLLDAVRQDRFWVATHFTELEQIIVDRHAELVAECRRYG
jgi:NAD(P)-dependent dehydrogenase (short-subunit alcohol dehydrogenase family)